MEAKKLSLFLSAVTNKMFTPPYVQLIHPL